MSTTTERHPLTVQIETILRGRTYDDHAADEDLFDELLVDIDEAVAQALPGGSAGEPQDTNRPALDPQPIAEQIDAILADVKAHRLDRTIAHEQITAILDTYADDIDTAGGGEDGDPDMWSWSERVRFADIPDGYEWMKMDEYLGQFSDALTCLWSDPRTADDG